MSARKIPTSHRAITGRYPMKRLRVQVAFESLLERDFLILVDLDRDVASVEGQPVKLEWRDREARRYRRYTPDFLVTFRPPDEQVPEGQSNKTCPWLIEVKDRQTLKEKWSEFLPGFRVATAYAHKHGWRFHLMTENRIRTPLLKNARLLLPAAVLPEDAARCEVLLQNLRSHGALTVRDLAAIVCAEQMGQAPFLRMIWRMLAQREISADLSLPLGMNTLLHPPEGVAPAFLARLYR